MANIKQTFRPPACKMNKKTLEKICKFLDEQNSKMKGEDDHTPDFEIQIKTKRKDLEFNSSKEFLLQDIPNDLQRISFDLRKYLDYQTRIEINISFEWWNTPEIVVSGKDSMWVNGVVKELEDIFGEKSTKHGLLYDNKTFIPILFGLALLSALAINIAISIFDSENIDSENIYDYLVNPTGFIGGLFLSFSSWIFWRWLFPLIEIEGIGIQQKIRTGTIVIIGMVIVGLITTTIYEKFQ